MSVTQMLFSGKGLGAISENNPPTHHGGLSALRPGSGLPPNLTNPLNTLMAPPPARYQNNLAMAGIQQLPESFDWRKTSKKHNISLESVKNQNQCGNCWAMATASVLSDRYNVSGNPLSDLSPLYLIACDEQDDACDGGTTQSAGVFCEKNGIAKIVVLIGKIGVRTVCAQKQSKVYHVIFLIAKRGVPRRTLHIRLMVVR